MVRDAETNPYMQTCSRLGLLCEYGRKNPGNTASSQEYPEDEGKQILTVLSGTAGMWSNWP